MGLPLVWTRRRAAPASWHAAWLLIGLAAPAHAQLFNQFVPLETYGTDTAPDVTVGSRIHPGYDNGGIHAGNFTIRPRLTEAGGYESNPLGLSNARGSAFVQSTGSVYATSTSSVGSVTLGGAANDIRYISLPKQSFTVWNAQAGGTLNVGRDTLSANYVHENQVQTQLDLDVGQLGQPLDIMVDRVRLDYRAQLNHLSLTPNLEVGRYHYNSGEVNGTIYDQSFRNRVAVTPGIVAAYDFATRRSIVGVVRNTIGLYSRGTPTNPKRDFNDTALLGGVDYDVNGFLRARLLAGYEQRSFNSSAYKQIAAPVAELTLVYNPTGLTSLTGIVSRRIQDSTDETTAAVTSLVGTLRIDHELRRNVILTADGGITHNDYVGGSSQNLFTGDVIGSYLINRYASAGATYGVIARTTSGFVNLNTTGTSSSSNFIDHRFLLQLRLSL